jgi:hypothetical protein
VHLPDSPLEPRAAPAFLSSHFKLPPVPDTSSDAEVGGAFLIGEGRYEATLALRDDLGRTCIHEWQIEARSGRSARGIENPLPPNTVAALARVKPQRPAAIAPGRLTVLLHAAPSAPRGATVACGDIAASLGELSSLMQQEPDRSVHLVVFNLDQQKILLREDSFRLQDLNRVQESIYNLQLAAVDYRTLVHRTGSAELLLGILDRELNGPEPPDTVVFIGPHRDSAIRLARRSMRLPAHLPRFFYVAYRRSPKRLDLGTPGEMQAATSLPLAASDITGPVSGMLSPLPARPQPAGTDLIADVVSRFKG